MKLLDLMTMAEKDMNVDPDKLDQESLRIPNLHAKYMRILVHEKLVMRNHLSTHKELESLKWQWYSGKLSKEELASLGWEQYPHVISPTKIKILMDGDSTINHSKKLIALQEQKIEYLESTIKIINIRHWHIRTAVDWRKFLAGNG